jgi:hypothetical protein
MLYFKRYTAGAACLQPLHLSAGEMAQPGSAAAAGSRKAEGAAAAAGPFIFNPYAAKRKGASAAAAAEAALPEWVSIRQAAQSLAINQLFITSQSWLVCLHNMSLLMMHINPNLNSHEGDHHLL